MAVDRRALIVEAANRSFALFGYKGTTMEQVAKIANVGKGTIYTFFTNKEELFQEVLNRLLIEIKLTSEQVIQQHRGFFDNLSEVLDALLEFRKDHALALKLTQEVREIGTPKAIEAIQQVEDTIIEHIAVKVEQAIDNQEIQSCDPQLTAFILLRLYMALAVEWSNKHQSMTKQKIAETLRMYVERGLGLS